MTSYIIIGLEKSEKNYINKECKDININSSRNITINRSKSEDKDIMMSEYQDLNV